MRILVKNVWKQYVARNGQKIDALRGVTLDIYAGEVLALLGPNGAGKTTLASLLVTLTPPTSGDIYFEGKSIFEQIYHYRRLIGFCPQSPNLRPELTIEQNIYLSAKVYGLCNELAKIRTTELMDRYHLTKYKDYSIKDLSGGYKQRASIARAMVHEPQILLFDEPTVGLDPHIREELWNEIKKLRNAGLTIILTTHYLDEAELLADRVCILVNGQIKILDTPQNVLSSKNVKSLQEGLVGLFKDG